MKRIKCYTRDGYVKYYDSEEEVMVSDEYDWEKNQLRGVWFSTVENIDLVPFDTKEEGMKFVDEVVETYRKYNLNCIVCQVRPTNDALYESKINPWSSFLNKNRVEDVNPGFDFLAYMIEKAKEYNIEVHAWINPYRVTNKNIEELKMTKMDYLNTLSERNFARMNPDLVLETSGHKLILDPASSLVQEYLVETIMELANNYDIKAVHIDDYFYPYDEIIDPLEEEKQMKILPYMDKAAFRRYNVNEMIRKIHEALKGANKKVEFGISPFAIYRTNSKYFEKANKVGGWYRGSDNIVSAFQCYEGLYADVYLWMKEGWIDYVCPQDYFAIDYYKELEDGTQIDIAKYADILKWWNDMSKETKTKLYIGMGLYRVSDTGVWANEEEIINQLKLNNMHEEVKGFVMFTYKNLVKANSETMKKVHKRLLEVWNK